MHIDSTHIGQMDSIIEYQKLSLNNAVGEYLKTNKVNIKENQMLYLKLNSLNKAWKMLEQNYTLYQISSERVFIIADNFLAELWLSYTSDHIGVQINLSSDTTSNTNKYIANIKKLLKDITIDKKAIEFEIIQYENAETLNRTFYHTCLDIDFNPLAVPFVDDVDSYIKGFIDSKAPVLILLGEPGTGKTTFTKHILNQMKKSYSKDNNMKAMYSFDENIFYCSNFFKELIYDDNDVVVLEDINQVIHKNQDDPASLNPLNKLLSVTDGIISRQKKIIITTNITSKSQLNQALIRPGRCYDVLEFRKLEGVEIDNLCDSCDKNMNLQIESINASEFYAKYNDEQNNKILNTNIGFMK
jgi:hypothetical protein